MSPQKDPEWVIKEIDDTIRRCEELLPNVESETEINIHFFMSHDPRAEPRAIEARLLLEQTVHRLAPNGSMYARQREAVTRQSLIGLPAHVAARKALQFRAILRAMRFDYERGAIRTFEQTVRADLFSDQLEIASYFLEEGFLAAAAVTAGVVLEEHLRTLADRRGVPLRPAKGQFVTAERINQALNGSAYDLGDMKQVTAWLDLRNSGAHPRHKTKLTSDRVAGMIDGVRGFVDRHPA